MMVVSAIIEAQNVDRRRKYEREGQRYASNVSDAEWALIEPHMPAAKPRKFAAGETRRRSETDSKSGPLATVPLDLAEGRRLPRPGLAQAGEAGRRLGISL